jgi:hypothetical protein
MAQAHVVTSDVRSSAASRQAAYRARKGRQLNVLVPEDVADALDEYMARQLMDGDGLSRSEVIVKLLRSQLFRKR